MQTDNYFLKEIAAADITAIHRGLSNPAVTKYYDVHYDTLEATTEQMDWYANLKKNGTGIWFGVYNKTNDEFCGAGGFSDLDQNDQRAEIGFWLLPEFWGQGIMSEVMPKLFEVGFTTLNLNRIEAYVVSDNKKCKSALKKINLTHEGTMREYEVKDGQKIDLDVYAILKREWKKN